LCKKSLKPLSEKFLPHYIINFVALLFLSFILLSLLPQSVDFIRRLLVYAMATEIPKADKSRKHSLQTNVT